MPYSPASSPSQAPVRLMEGDLHGLAPTVGCRGKPRPYDRTVAGCNIVIPLAKPSGTPRMVTLARAGSQDDQDGAEDAEGDQRGEGGILATLPTRLSTSGDSPTVSTSWGRPGAGRRAREHLMVPVDFSVVAERP